MSRYEVLERLRPNWAISKEEDYLTEQPGWAVHSLMNGEYYERLSWGKTVPAAIKVAEAYVAQEEREQAERDADYARRKAAGLLTPIEVAGGCVPSVWSEEMARVISEPSVLLSSVNRAYESEVVKP